MERSIRTAFLMFLITTSVSAQDNAVYRLQRKSLEGITDVHVIVEKINREVEKDGVFTDQLQTDIELRLRKSGIKVVSLENLQPNRKALLHVSVSVAKGDGVYAYSIIVEVIQSVNLKNKSADSLPAATWERTLTGLIPSARLEDLRRSVTDLTDQFINEWLAANGK